MDVKGLGRGEEANGGKLLILLEPNQIGAKGYQDKGHVWETVHCRWLKILPTRLTFRGMGCKVLVLRSFPVYAVGLDLEREGTGPDSLPFIIQDFSHLNWQVLENLKSRLYFVVSLSSSSKM